jgi:hypothetical protein
MLQVPISAVLCVYAPLPHQYASLCIFMPVPLPELQLSPAPVRPRWPRVCRLLTLADRCSALCHLRHRLQTRLHAPTVPMPAPAGHFPVDNVDKPVENFCLRGLPCGQTWGELRAPCRSPTNGPGPCRLLPWELPTCPILRRSPLRTRHTHLPKVTDPGLPWGQVGHGDRSGPRLYPELPTCPTFRKPFCNSTAHPPTESNGSRVAMGTGRALVSTPNCRPVPSPLKYKNPGTTCPGNLSFVLRPVTSRWPPALLHNTRGSTQGGRCAA